MTAVSRAALLLAASLIMVSLAFCMAGEKSYAEGEDDYQFGTAGVWSTFGGEMLDDSFYYSDSWFSEDPETENDSLALVSMQVTAAATTDEEEGEGAAFLKKLGFTDIGFYGFRTEDEDDCAYMYGKKKIGDKTVIAIVVQSYSTVSGIKVKGWKQNFTVNGEDPEGEHYALGKAADSVLGRIAALTGSADGNVRYWITGHSRGGALANLISAKLPARLAAQGTDAGIYAYTFEAPSTIDSNAIDDPDKYGYIHNFRCSDDIVTMVPPAAWGKDQGSSMTLYGVIHQLNSEKTDANLKDELKKLGSKMKVIDDSGLGDITAESIIAKLVSRIPERADYSKQNSESFTTLDGQEKTIEYSHQGTFVRLMEIIFGENKIKTAGLADRIGDAVPALDSYIRGYLTELGKLEVTDSEARESDARAYYFDAAKKLCEFLKSKKEPDPEEVSDTEGEVSEEEAPEDEPEDEELPFTEEEAYALLELAAPVLIDPAVADEEQYAVTEEPMKLEQAFAYLSPGLTVAVNADELVFSHHFDTCIARLKSLAPQPEMDGIALTIPEPKTGDAVSKVTRDVENAVDDLGITWLDASAKWDTDDPTIRKNKTYYVDLKFYIKGHLLSESAKFTLNGQEPCAEPKISYKDGITTVRCAYEFTFGTPKEYKISFESEYGETPEDMIVTEGTMLKYVPEPVVTDVEGYRFSRWDKEGSAWDDITASDETSELGEIYFYAKWIELIDKIEITFSVPAVGQKWNAPSVPKNAPYHLEEISVQNSDYKEIVKVSKKEELMLSFSVVPNSSGRELLVDDDGGYIGTIKVKGATLDYSYTDSESNLFVGCLFTPKDNKVTALQKGGAFKMADKVIRGTKSDRSLKGSSKSPLKLKASKKTKKSIKLTWKKAKGAKSYVVYGALKGKKMTKIATVKKNSYTVKKAGKKLAKGKKYKFIVVARKGSKVVSTSATVLTGTSK